MIYASDSVTRVTLVAFTLKFFLSLSSASDVGARRREPPQLHGKTAGESNH